MKRCSRETFERRFYRGLASVAPQADVDYYVDRVCNRCGAETKRPAEAAAVLCFTCDNATNPFSHLADVGLSMEAAGLPSTNPQRIKDKTEDFNIGLRGIDTVVGTRPDGKPKLEYRPVAQNELPTNRSVREYAKRTGCTPLNPNPKVAIGGKK